MWTYFVSVNMSLHILVIICYMAKIYFTFSVNRVRWCGFLQTKWECEVLKGQTHWVNSGGQLTESPQNPPRETSLLGPLSHLPHSNTTLSAPLSVHPITLICLCTHSLTVTELPLLPVAPAESRTSLLSFGIPEPQSHTESPSLVFHISLHLYKHSQFG